MESSEFWPQYAEHLPAKLPTPLKEECFRLWISQAGIHEKVRFKTTDFLTVSVPKKLVETVDRMGLNTLARLDRHLVRVTFDSSLTRIVNSATITGFLCIAPKRMTLVQLKDRMRMTHTVDLPEKARASFYHQLKDHEYKRILYTDDLKVWAGQTKKMLILKYVAVLGPYPDYPTQERDVLKFWNKWTKGILP